MRDLGVLSSTPATRRSGARTTRLPSGLEVVAHRRGHFSPNPAHQQEYVHVLAQTAPYYPFVLTDWSPLRLDRSADVVLDHTDRLILCCGTADWFLDAAVRMLTLVRGGGRRTWHGGPWSSPPSWTGPRAGACRTRSRGGARRAEQVVHVPFDAALQSPGWELHGCGRPPRRRSCGWPTW